MWTLNPKAERMSDIRHYVADPEVRRLSWQSRLAHPAWTAAPNAGHQALAAFEHRGRLHALVTQNIDGLHQRAGNSPGRVIEDVKIDLPRPRSTDLLSDESFGAYTRSLRKLLEADLRPSGH